MYEAFSAFFTRNNITQWRIKSADVFMQAFELQLSKSPSNTLLHHIDIAATRSLLQNHSHILVMLLPIPAAGTIPRENKKPDLAAFASGHYYRRAVKLLQSASKILYEEAGISKCDIRIFSNSRFPEKLFGRSADLGGIGKNSLLINKELGSNFIIAGAAINAPESGLELLSGDICPEIPDCAGCRLCIRNCPSEAIRSDGSGIIIEKCIQHRSTEVEVWDNRINSIWGTRLYGCMTCQEVCPFNQKDLQKEENTVLFETNSPLEYEVLIDKFIQEQSLKSIFKHTALEASWIPRKAILRNIIIAAANAALPYKTMIKVNNLFKQLPDRNDPVIASAISWFREKYKSTE